MSPAPLRFRDFALEARSRRAEAPAYGAAEVEAIRRQAFAAGRAEGQAAAEAAADAAAAGRQSDLERLVREVADARAAAESLLAEALSALEAAFCAALAAAAPALARSQGAEPCAAALREALQAVRLPSVAVRAGPETVALLQAAGPPWPDGVRFSADPALAEGCAHLRWADGGATVRPEDAARAVQAAVAAALPGAAACLGGPVAHGPD